MKNNKMMRAASGLMIAALLTTGMISGTFAKYTTQDELNDSARVAKWGVNLGISGNLYGEAYAAADNNTIIANTANGATVKSSADGTKVVAPGTKNANSGLHITLNGKPEVSTKVYGTVKTQNIYLANGTYGVMVEANHVTAEDFAAGKKYYSKSGESYTETNSYATGTTYFTLEDEVTIDNTYYPVVYKGAGVTSGTTGADSLDAIGANIAKMLKGSDVTPVTANGVSTYTVSINDVTATIPNTDLAASDSVLKDINSANITWEWSFSGNDGADTILGDLIASNAGTVSNVVLKDSGSAFNVYKPITVSAGTGLATVDGSTTPVASTKTSFAITLTVEQAD